MNYKDSPHLIEVFDFDILHLELNTLVYILVLLLVVMFFLNRWLFRPMLRTLDNRSHHLDRLRDAVANHKVEIVKLTEDYEASLTRVRAEVAQVRQESHKEVRAEVEGLLADAREAAQADFEKAIQDLRAQTDKAREDLKSSSSQLADQISERLVNG